jgi:hypothetical protein
MKALKVKIVEVGSLEITFTSYTDMVSAIVKELMRIFESAATIKT